MLDALSTLDWLCVGVLLASMLVGAWRGLVVEVLSLVSWAAAFVLAQWWAPDVAAKLPMAGAGEQVRYAAGFVLVFVATLFAGALIGFVISKLLSVVGLGALNRLLGALFGVLRAGGRAVRAAVDDIDRQRRARGNVRGNLHLQARAGHRSLAIDLPTRQLAPRQHRRDGGQGHALQEGAPSHRLECTASVWRCHGRLSRTSNRCRQSP